MSSLASRGPRKASSHARRQRGNFARGLLLLALLSGAVGFLGLGTVRQVLSSWVLGQGPYPYFIPSEALALYMIVPLSSIGLSIFFLLPGLILTAVLGREKSLALWIISGFGASIVVLTAAVTAVELSTGWTLTGNGFFTLVALTNVLAFTIMGLQLARGGRVQVNLEGQQADIWVAVGLFWAVLLLMAPKFYWENFSGDGSGALQFARNLIHSHWPFWPYEAGVIRQAPGVSSVLFVFPESWFVRFWGEWEYSARALHLMALALLYPVLTALIRFGRPDAFLRWTDHLLLVAALYLYSMTNIYSGGYHAWFGDSPMPAARETLAMVFFMGYILAFLTDRRWLMLGAGIMAYLSIPTGGLWLLLWPLAVAVVWRPAPKDKLIFAGVVLSVCAAIAVLAPIAIRLTGLPFPGEEFDAAQIIQRLRYVALVDWQRFAFLALPVGIVPVLFLFTWKRQDQLARALTLLTVVFFFFFYLQGYRVLLHHFIPAMIPPLVIMWRSDLMEGAVGRLVAGLGIVIALLLTWPKDMGLHSHDRAFAAYIQTEGAFFDSGKPADGERFRGFDPRALDVFHELFGRLLPIGYGITEPGERFYGAPLVWWYYSEFPKAEGQIINYTLKPLADASPADGTLFDSYKGYGLYIRDMALFDQQRAQKLPYDTGAALLSTPRDVLFGRGAKWPQTWSDRVVIDLIGIAKRVLGRG